MSRFLVTGGAGFAGSHLVRELVSQGHEVTVFDMFTYSGLLENLAGVDCKIVYCDISRPIYWPDDFDYVIHNGAESHVARSLEDPGKFVQSNIIGTLNVLEWVANDLNCKKFVYVSTDEVFGPAGIEPFHEGDRLRPSNPYSATKAGGEFIARAYFRSFSVPTLITRTTNMFGERQHVEKFVPLVTNKLLKGERVDLHLVNGVMGSRRWVYAGEQAKALTWLALHGTPGKAYHVAEGVRFTNLEIADKIAKILGVKPHYNRVEMGYLGHDLDYNVSTAGTPERENWRLSESFDALLEKTVRWYQDRLR